MTLHIQRMAKIKKMSNTEFGKDGEQWELSYIAAQNAKQYNYFMK